MYLLKDKFTNLCAKIMNKIKGKNMLRLAKFLIRIIIQIISACIFFRITFGVTA